MRLLAYFFILMLIMLHPLRAKAEVRDIELGTKGKTALSLMRFDKQPVSVQVQANNTGVKVTILGVQAKKGQIIPPDTHLVQAIDIIPLIGGVQLHYRFSSAPVQGGAEIYNKSVLLRASFAHDLRAQHASLSFAPHKPQTPVPVNTEPQMAALDTDTAKPDARHNPAKTEPAHGTDNHNEDVSTPAKPAHPAGQGSGSTHKADNDQPMRDGDIAPTPPVRGTGMVREASVTPSPSSQKLDAKTCAMARKAIEDDPWALDKLSLYGACIAKEGKKEEAKEVFERLLTFDPDMISAYMGLGAIAQESGNADKASAYYKQALDLGGTDAEAAQVRAALNTLGQHH